MSTWRYDLDYPGHGSMWEEGFESYDDAYDAMTEAMTELIDSVAEEHPELTDEEIEARIDWDVREG